jgi:hypothetical protein
VNEGTPYHVGLVASHCALDQTTTLIVNKFVLEIVDRRKDVKLLRTVVLVSLPFHAVLVTSSLLPLPSFCSPWTRSRKYLLWRFLPVEYHWAKSKQVNSLNPDKYSFNHLNISYLEKRTVKGKSSVSFEKSTR